MRNLLKTRVKNLSKPQANAHVHTPSHPKRGWKNWVALLTLALVCLTPLACAWAADGAAPSRPNGWAGGMGVGMMPVNTEGLTKAQLTAYEAAKSAYEQTEDAVLADLLAAGLATQEDITAYQDTRTQQAQRMQGGQFPQGGQMPADGQMPQDGQGPQDGQQPQGDPMGRNRGPQGGGFGLWGTLMQNSTDATVQQALTTMQQAQQVYQQALEAAGIQTTAPMQRGA